MTCVYNQNTDNGDKVNMLEKVCIYFIIIIIIIIVVVWFNFLNIALKWRYHGHTAGMLIDRT